MLATAVEIFFTIAAAGISFVLWPLVAATGQNKHVFFSIKLQRFTFFMKFEFILLVVSMFVAAAEAMYFFSSNYKNLFHYIKFMLVLSWQ